MVGLDEADHQEVGVRRPSLDRLDRAGEGGVELLIADSGSTDGAVENATVVEANPEGVFDRAVLRAIEGWAYAPASASTEGVQQRFDFNLGG